MGNVTGIDTVSREAIQQTFPEIVPPYSTHEGNAVPQSSHLIGEDSWRPTGKRPNKIVRPVQRTVYPLAHYLDQQLTNRDYFRSCHYFPLLTATG